MSDSVQDRFRATELDSELLTTPFQVDTNWHVITGGACCGKTTLIDLLAEKGYETLPEIPRQYIECELARGRALDEIFASEDDERAMTEWQRRAEQELSPTDVVFMDRALPDFLWAWRFQGMDPNEILPACFHHRYASVLILDLLPLELDGARIEGDMFTVQFDEWLVRDYGALGYQVVRVPVLPPQERVDFVLASLSERGLI
jgi:predicted ATPase